MVGVNLDDVFAGKDRQDRAPLGPDEAALARVIQARLAKARTPLGQIVVALRLIEYLRDEATAGLRRVRMMGVLEARRISGLSVDEVAAKTGMTSGSVTRLVTEANAELREVTDVTEAVAARRKEARAARRSKARKARRDSAPDGLD